MMPARTFIASKNMIEDKIKYVTYFMPAFFLDGLPFVVALYLSWPDSGAFIS